MTLTDSAGNSRTVITSALGYYRFTDVAAGQTCIITATGKRYSFSQPTQVINVGEDETEINFVAYLTESRSQDFLMENQKAANAGSVSATASH